MPHRLALPVGLAFLLAFLGSPPAHAEQADAGALLAEAVTDLAMLEDMIDDDDASDRELLTYLDLAVTHAVALHQHASKLDEEGPDARKVKRGIESYRDDVIDALLDALDEVDFNAAERNERAEVNAHAGALLARTPAFLEDERARTKLSRRLVRKVKRFEKMRHDPGAEVFGATFDALAALGDERSMRWVMDNYLHTRKRAEDVARMREAMQALRHWDPMPGDVRYDLVDEMVKLYVAVEDLARTSTTDTSALAARRLWDDIHLDAIALIQRAAGYPEGSDGRALARMADYKWWFGSHDKKRDPVWRAPAPDPRES